MVRLVPSSRRFRKREILIVLGQFIRHCKKQGVIALTFDDGPCPYTEQLLDLLDAYKAKATFFINGNNQATPLDSWSTPWPELLIRMINSGHQIGSHTWTHANLEESDTWERHEQMEKNDEVIGNILGFTPTYMRPPYGSCSKSSGCLQDMGDMGYKVIGWDLDTNDWRHQDDISISKSIFDNEASWDPTSSSNIVLAHDIHAQTVWSLAEYMIKGARERGYKLVTVGECLADPKKYWYRKT
jgi:peptidoglycan/xylan/chitin deacetylase (PgdA/CDA1 family)